ncbi:hypothetical protein MARPU_14730 [Marichromatium purpuratum 984]|uniref:Uncharacterized protein n=1 Tax=Marichromatium purpuratum 984 TaxID=765910 RepID=W0E8R9_MARPU|nr:hypothetical protein MARPU_14730 [Marichromatium purpuratum 984]
MLRWSFLFAFLSISMNDVSSLLALDVYAGAARLRA